MAPNKQPYLRLKGAKKLLSGMLKPESVQLKPKVKQRPWSLMLLPVVIFLVVLVYMDSYKLVSLKTVLGVITLGGLSAIAALYVNGWLLDLFSMNLKQYSRYVAPIAEESLKALVIIYLFRSSKIGFLVDSAIMGFAVGAGFALVENFYYLQSHTDARSKNKRRRLSADKEKNNETRIPKVPTVP